MPDNTLELLLESCRIPLERFVHYKMRCTADAEDVLQNTYLAAIVHFSSLRDHRLFKTWILRIAANECALYYRRQYRHETVSIDELGDLAEEMQQSPDVEGVLERMPHDSANLIRAFYLDGFSQREIASRLGIPTGTVKSRLYKAKEQFRTAAPDEMKMLYQKGEKVMSKITTGKFTEFMPTHTITKANRPFAPVKFEEEAFIIPRIGNTNAEATYRYPQKKLFVVSHIRVAKPARIHGVDGVKIVRDTYNVKAEQLYKNEAIWFAQLTDEYLRNLAFIRCESEDDLPTEICTFLEEDYDVIVNGNDRVHGLPIWIQENPAGSDEKGALLPVPNLRYTMGSYDVTIGEKTFACIKIGQVELCGRYTEQYIDENGRLVLYRVYETAEAMEGCYSDVYIESAQKNARVTVNGMEYIHIDDRFSEYVL